LAELGWEKGDTLDDATADLTLNYAGSGSHMVTTPANSPLFGERNYKFERCSCERLDNTRSIL
jgi:hypothetical protein